MAVVIWFLIKVWESPCAENCCLSLSICLFNSLSPVQILLILIAYESGRFSLKCLEREDM